LHERMLQAGRCRVECHSRRIVTNLKTIVASISQLGVWLKRELLADVPEEPAVCEFECRRIDCRYKEHLDCRRRVSPPAVSLMPALVRIRGSVI
jgi:hypothetical protein